MNRVTKAWILLAVTFAVLAALAFVLTQQHEVDNKTQGSSSRVGQGSSTTARNPQESAEPDLSVPFSEYPSANSYPDFALLYFALADLEPTEKQYQQIAAAQSNAYRRLPEGFARLDAMKTLKPKIQSQVENFKQRYFYLKKEIYLGAYDPDIQAFPLIASMGMPSSYRWKLDEYRGMIDGEGIKLTASNQDRFTQFVVKDEAAARALDKLTQRNRRCTAKIYLFGEQVTDEPFGPVIHARIVRLEIFSRDGHQIATLQ